MDCIDDQVLASEGKLLGGSGLSVFLDYFLIRSFSFLLHVSNPFKTTFVRNSLRPTFRFTQC
jgi:hypothetical protein